MIAGAHEGRENHRTKGVKTTETTSCTNIRIFIANNWPNSSWTYLEDQIKYHHPNSRKRCNHFLAMKLHFPLIGHIMGIGDDLRHEHLGIEDSVLFGYHASSHGKDGTKYSKVKDHSTVW